MRQKYSLARIAEAFRGTTCRLEIFWERNFYLESRQYSQKNFIHKILGWFYKSETFCCHLQPNHCVVFILKAFHAADNGTWNYVANRLEKPGLMKKSIPPQRHVSSFTKCQFLLSPHNNTRNAPEFVFHCSKGKRLDASQGTKAIYRGLKCSVSSFAHNNERQSQKVVKTAMKIYDCLLVRARRKVSKMFLPRVVNLWMTNGIGC